MGQRRALVNCSVLMRFVITLQIPSTLSVWYIEIYITLVASNCCLIQCSDYKRII